MIVFGVTTTVSWEVIQSVLIRPRLLSSGKQLVQKCEQNPVKWKAWHKPPCRLWCVTKLTGPHPKASPKAEQQSSGQKRFQHKAAGDTDLL